MEQIKLTENINVCWCNYCAKKIWKGENYLFIHKGAWKSPKGVDINICLLCLVDLTASINPLEVEEIKLKNIEIKL